jgi:hypothetical protein
MQEQLVIPSDINAPGFRFQGGKCLLRKWIVGHFPRQGEVYIEPFAGRGNLFWLACQLCNYETWWLNDNKMVPFFQAIEEVEVSKVPFRITKADRRWLVEGRANGEPVPLVTEPLWGWGGGSMSGNYTREWSGVHNGSIRPWLTFIRHLRDAKALLAKHEPNKTALDYTDMPWDVWDDSCFAYVDPPYHSAINVRSYKRVDYAELIEILSTTRCRWLLSEYDHSGYREAFGAPIATKLTRAGSARHRPERLECLYASPNLRV